MIFPIPVPFSLILKPNFCFFKILEHQPSSQIGVRKRKSSNVDDPKMKQIAEHTSTDASAIKQLWNFKEKREATMKEGISTLLEQSKKLKET